MSAPTALSAALPSAASDAEVLSPTVGGQEIEPADAKVATEEIAAERTDAETNAADEDDTVLAQEDEPSASAESIAESRNATEGVPYSAEQQVAAKQSAVERVRQTSTLPPGMRERLAAAIETNGQLGNQGQVLVSVEEAIRAVSESLPGALRMNRDQFARPGHPDGESFFSGASSAEMSDQQAEAIARGQLARSGMLRGQKVRAAQD